MTVTHGSIYVKPDVERMLASLVGMQFSEEYWLDKELYTLYLRNKLALPPYFWDGETFIRWVKINIPWVLTRIRNYPDTEGE